MCMFEHGDSLLLVLGWAVLPMTGKAWQCEFLTLCLSFIEQIRARGLCTCLKPRCCAPPSRSKEMQTGQRCSARWTSCSSCTSGRRASTESGSAGAPADPSSGAWTLRLPTTATRLWSLRCASGTLRASYWQASGVTHVVPLLFFVQLPVPCEWRLKHSQFWSVVV